MIICGFAGIGKSTLVKSMAGWIDLESTPFNKDWDTYVRVANHMNNNNYNVLLSCHKELREKLLENNIPFIVVIPDSNDKDLYIDRYKNRGNTKEFINMMEEKFEDFINEIESDNRLVIRRLTKDKLYLIDLIKDL